MLHLHSLGPVRPNAQRATASGYLCSWSCCILHKSLVRIGFRVGSCCGGQELGSGLLNSMGRVHGNGTGLAVRLHCLLFAAVWDECWMAVLVPSCGISLSYMHKVKHAASRKVGPAEDRAFVCCVVGLISESEVVLFGPSAFYVAVMRAAGVTPLQDLDL